LSVNLKQKQIQEGVKKMSTSYAQKQPQPGIELGVSETEYQLKEQIKFTAPALDTVISPNPQTRLPLLTEFATLEGSFSLDAGELFHPDHPVPTLDKVMLAAERAIMAKAGQLNWVGAATSQIDQVGQGYVIRYEAADIYYSVETGAHEVHGDIRAKYNAFGAANGVLGLPTTDESGTPGDIGRFNHFQGGSIYWRFNTGPMVVRGAIRDMWAMQGWERSSFGYPVADYFTKTTNPPEYWGGFQNGAIYSNNNIPAEALVAEIAPQDLTNQVRKTFDQALKAASSDLGIEGGVNVLNISDWGYGFWESSKRTITYEIHGFYSHGIPFVPDPTFRLELQFQFGLVWRKDNFTQPKATSCDHLRSTLRNLELQLAKIDKFLSEPLPKEKNPPKPKINPAWATLDKQVQSAQQSLRMCDASNTSGALTLSQTDKTLVIYLKHWHISTSGVGHEELEPRLVKELPQKFPFAVKTIPGSTLLIDVLVTPQGGLKFLLQPSQFGKIRLDAFQTALNSFIES
jgi:LGFP repeat